MERELAPSRGGIARGESPQASQRESLQQTHTRGKASQGWHWRPRPGRPVVVIGLLGPKLDAGGNPERWQRWRPSVSICQHADLIVDRFELLHSPQFRSIADEVIEDLGRVSPETTVNLHPVTFSDPWDFEEVYDALYGFTRSYDFDPEAEDYLIHITTGSHVAQICTFLLTESRHLPGRLLQTSPPGRGARIGRWRVIDLDLSRYDAIAQRFVVEQQEALSFLKAGIETRNAAFNHMIEQIERVAIVSEAPMLLTGPTGAGKTQLARRIFALKKSRNQVTGEYVEVNCATLRGDTAQSTLFGHIKGAFTGAQNPRPGLLKTADQGVLFLDEIGELGLDEQAMLLRALESGEFLPVGADRPAFSRFQLIAGTNRDLRAAVMKGTFREDLLARINLWTFELPGLKARIEDLAPNLDYELDRFAERTGAQVRFNAEARARFLRFGAGPEGRWRANFRDLNAAVTRMATLAHGGRITEVEVEEEIGRLNVAWRTPEEAQSAPQQAMLEQVLGKEAVEQLDRFDRVQLLDVLSVCRQCKTLSEAGRLLFAYSRTQRKQVNDADRLRKYLARFDLTWGVVKERLA
ncbi:MAG: RNA repair transcriptional activator RtcR [Bradymonadia bacterium]